jgi:hypothetical protein
MAKIPRISPTNRTPTSQVPSRTRETGGGFGKVIETLGNTGQQIGEQLFRANLLREETEAENAYNAKVLDIKTRAENDDDTSVESFNKYDEELTRSITEASKAIKTPAARQLFELNAKGKSELARVGISNTFTKKSIEIGKQNLEISLDDKKGEFIRASGKDKQRIMLETKELLNKAKDAGYVSATELVDLERGISDEWKKAQVDFDIQTDPDLASLNITSGVYDLNAEEEKKYLTLANDLRTKRAKEEKLRVQAGMQETEIDLYNKVSTGEASLLEINDAEARGLLGLDNGIRKEVATALRKLVTKGDKADPRAKADEFIRLHDVADKLMDEGGTVEEAMKFRDDVALAMANGTITKTVGNKWFEAASEKIEKKPFNGWKVLKEFAKTFSIAAGVNPMGLAELGQEVIERTLKGENEKAVTEEIIEREKRNNNPESSKYKIGDVIDTPQGSMKVIGFFPDGEADVVPN